MSDPRDLVRRAQRELKRCLVPSHVREENAAGYLEKAGHVFRARACHADAAECFERAADLLGTAAGGAGTRAAAALLQAAGVQLKITGDARAHQVTDRAIRALSELGKGFDAATLAQGLGHECEVAKEHADAARHFQRAADLLNGEGRDSEVQRCLARVATNLAATGGAAELLHAARLFEQVGLAAQTERLLQFTAPRHLFCAVLCTMASGDAIGARAKNAEFAILNHRYNGSREARFADDLVAAMQNHATAQFSAAYREYTRTAVLDAWHVALLRKAHKACTATEDVPDKERVEGHDGEYVGEHDREHDGKRDRERESASQSASQSANWDGGQGASGTWNVSTASALGSDEVVDSAGQELEFV